MSRGEGANQRKSDRERADGIRHRRVIDMVRARKEAATTTRAKRTSATEAATTTRAKRTSATEAATTTRAKRTSATGPPHDAHRSPTAAEAAPRTRCPTAHGASGESTHA